MKKSEIILEHRGLVLNGRDEYMTQLVKTLEEMFEFSFRYASGEEDLLEKCYTFEPMVILSRLTLENIGILVNASRIGRYKRSVSIGLASELNEGVTGLVDSEIITQAVQCTGSPEHDAALVFRAYKVSVKFGMNMKGLAGTMPVVTELLWNDSAKDMRQLRSAVSDKLERLGILKPLAGHKYLIAAIALNSSAGCVPEPAKLYARIADYYETTPQAVERDIRYAIEVAWTAGDIAYQHELFGMTIDEQKGKPTNAEFIARLALEF